MCTDDCATLSPGILSLVSINAIVLICVCPAPLFTSPAGADAEANAENVANSTTVDSS
jgi:hypothetical protein